MRVYPGVENTDACPKVPPGSTPSGRRALRRRRSSDKIVGLVRKSSRKLLKLPTEDLVRRIDQEDHFFGERMRSPEAIGAFQKFFLRKKK
jgi:hypothetical protein